jgi:cytochrome c
MDSFEWNKIAGAVLGTLIFVLVIKFGTEAIFEVPAPAKPGYVVEGVTEETSTASAAPVEEASPDWGTVLPKADAAAGQKISARCEQCHDLSKGGPNKIGPNLWGVLGRARGTHPGFSYSGAMTSSHDVWSLDNFFKFIKSPAAYVPGTKMSFAGLRSADDRINLIAWLRTQADSPLAIPAPKPAAAAPATPASAGGKAPATTAPAGTSTTAAPNSPTTPAKAPTAPAPAAPKKN